MIADAADITTKHAVDVSTRLKSAHSERSPLFVVVQQKELEHILRSALSLFEARTIEFRSKAA